MIIVAYLILAGLMVGGLYVWEDLCKRIREELLATEVGVDGSSPLGLGLANAEHGMTATVDADTSLETA